MEFQPLTEELVVSACELSARAGWEQTAGDWRRLMRLNPDGVRVWLDEGAVRASFSLTVFGSDLLWIGMVLVDTAYRGRGIGTAAFAAATEKAKAAGVKVAGLDATEQGEGVYRKFGFESVAEIVRWRGRWKDAGGKIPLLQEGFDGSVACLDREITGVDRSSLLEDLALSGAHFVRLHEEGRLRGYAVVKPSRTAFQVGPVIASSAAGFESLMRGCAARAGESLVICDVLHSDAPRILRANGLMPERTLKRMTQPRATDCLRNNRIWCGAGFELG